MLGELIENDLLKPWAQPISSGDWHPAAKRGVTVWTSCIATIEQLTHIAKVPKREFIRRGVNPHTLEKICRKEAVRACNLAKVVIALSQWESEQQNSSRSASCRARR
jgi:hypothetical protein